MPPKGSSMCVWQSTPPGTTYLPVASITRSAVAARSAPSDGRPGEQRDHALAVDQHVHRLRAGRADDGAARTRMVMSLPDGRVTAAPGRRRRPGAVAVERPAVAHLGQQVHVEVADDELGWCASATSPTNLPSGSTKYVVP